MTGIERKTMNGTPEEKKETLHTPGIPMRAAVYLRVATESQLSVQRETLHRLYVDKLQQKKNWFLTDVFVDIGIQRRNLLKWGQLRRLLQLCEAGEIDIIWTRSTSCFSRYTEELLDITKKFRELGITVIFEKEQLCSDDPVFEQMLTRYDKIARAAQLYT